MVDSDPFSCIAEATRHASLAVAKFGSAAIAAFGEWKETDTPGVQRQVMPGELLDDDDE